MARKSKATAEQHQDIPVAEPLTGPVPQDTPTAHAIVEGVAQSTQMPEERQPGDDSHLEPKKRKFEPVRGWHTEKRGTLDYRKMVDVNFGGGDGILFFKFVNKPDQETLAILKSDEMKQEGLKFQDTRKHGKIWMLPNDPEGRAAADRLDYRLSQLAEKRKEGTVQGPQPF